VCGNASNVLQRNVRLLMWMILMVFQSSALVYTWVTAQYLYRAGLAGLRPSQE
jgi:hypothetical protein